ncbi:MAG: hypothetical protein Q7R47_03335 [Candidatus Diapherotrites archaeon]|nr:hypothetical protein [Candidatus Diapherotrites archaeon]
MARIPHKNSVPLLAPARRRQTRDTRQLRHAQRLLRDTGHEIRRTAYSLVDIQYLLDELPDYKGPALSIIIGRMRNKPDLAQRMLKVNDQLRIGREQSLHYEDLLRRFPDAPQTHAMFNALGTRQRAINAEIDLIKKRLPPFRARKKK